MMGGVFFTRCKIVGSIITVWLVPAVAVPPRFTKLCLVAFAKGISRTQMAER